MKRTATTRSLALGALLYLLALTPSAQAACPNEAIRASQTSEALPKGTVELPACMALEMVSPPKKYVQAAYGPSFSTSGERVLFHSLAGLAETAGLHSYKGDSYIATRSASGWVPGSTSPPASAQIAVGGTAFGGPFSFSADLTRWAVFGSSRTDAAVGATRYYRGGLDGAFEAFSPLVVPIEDSGDPDVIFSVGEMEPRGTSSDLSTAIFQPDRKLPGLHYLPGDPHSTGEQSGGNGTQYIASDASGTPTLELLARDRLGEIWGGHCGTQVGGGGPTQGAISADGLRIYFATRPQQPFDSESGEGPDCSLANPLRILERVWTPLGPEIRELIPDGPAEGSDLYQGASVDQSKVFFTSPRALVPSDLDPSSEGCSATVGASAGCDLYLYDSDLPEAERLIQVSAGGAGDPTPGEGANVLSSITALSNDGTHVYFVAQAVLTIDPNPEGVTAVAGEPNLYLYQRDATHPDGRTAFVGTLADADRGKLWGVERSFFGDASAVPVAGQDGEGNEVGGDGHLLAFASKAALTADDGDGGHRDVFLYDASAGTLERISKAASGGSELPASDVSVNRNSFVKPFTDPAEEGRWVSEDAGEMAFTTAEPLLKGDEGGKANPYLWKEGTLARLPSDLQEPPTVSRSGDQVGFTSEAQILPQDGDTAKDAYVLRVGGGFLPPVEVQCDPLLEGTCPGSVAPPLIPGSPATQSFSGPGNVKQARRCRRGFVKRRGRCAKPQRQGKRRGRAHRVQGGGK